MGFLGFEPSLLHTKYESSSAPASSCWLLSIAKVAMVKLPNMTISMQIMNRIFLGAHLMMKLEKQDDITRTIPTKTGASCGSMDDLELWKMLTR